MIGRFRVFAPVPLMSAFRHFDAVFYGVDAAFYGISAAKCGAAGSAGTISRPQFAGGGADGRPSTPPCSSLRLSERFGLSQDLKQRLFETGQHRSFVRGQHPSRLLGHVPVCVAVRLAARLPVWVAAQVTVQIALFVSVRWEVPLTVYLKVSSRVQFVERRQNTAYRKQGGSRSERNDE
jgi:hypothetical protein